jgi:hypothetical protein
MGVQIPDMTDGAPADGTEIVPVSKSDNPRRISVSDIKTYIVDAIEAIAAGVAPTGADGVFLLQGGALKPVDIDLVAQYAIDLVWAATAEASPADADTLPMYDASEANENTVTLAVLAEYVRTKIEAAILDVSDLADGSGTLATTDYMLVTQGATAKRITVEDLYDAIYDGLAAHIGGLAAPGGTDDTDELILLKGGVTYAVTLADIASHIEANLTLNGSGTADYLAKWSDSDTLAAGPTIVGSGAGFSAGTDDSVPTTAAVRGELDSLVNDEDDINAALVDGDLLVVYDLSVTAQKKAALSRVKTWLAASPLQLPSYTVAGAPAATTAGQVIYVSNEAGGAVLAFSDGTNWRRVTDRTIIA